MVFDGCCPVTLQKQQRWQQGSQQFGVRHRGRIYYCLSDEARKAFLQDPDTYSPVFSGYDIVEFLEKGIMTEGKREFGCWFRGQVYLFSTKESSDKFVVAKQTFIEEIDKVQNPGRVAERTGVSTQR